MSIRLSTSRPTENEPLPTGDSVGAEPTPDGTDTDRSGAALLNSGAAARLQFHSDHDDHGR
jgi:hypothetical protein